MTPNKDMPLILGTQVMEDNKVAIDFHSKQLMMEKESSVVILQFAYKPYVPRHVSLCETEVETGLDQIETTEETEHGVTAETNLTLSCDEELEQISSSAIPDRNQQTDDRRTLLREFRDVFAMNDNELGQYTRFSMKLTQVIRCRSSLHPIDLHLERSLWLRRRLKTCQHETLSDHQTARTVHQSFSLPRRMGATECAPFRELTRYWIIFTEQAST